MKKLKLQELERLSVEDFKSSEKIPLIIVIDNVRSALNVGSIFRTADALGCEAVYICGISATPPHKEVHKTAIGATESVDWKYFESTLEAVQHLHDQEYAVYAIEQTDESVPLHTFQPAGKTAIILGNEVKGVSSEVLPDVDGAIEIEQFGTKHSFNVSVCCGIAAWSISRALRG